MKIINYIIKFFIICAISLGFYESLCAISAQEKAQIDLWIKKNKLNLYGDPANTIYKNGYNPLRKSDGKLMKIREYIISKHPDRPWSSLKVTVPPVSESKRKKIEAWLKKEGRNIYGDIEGTIYPAGYNPLKQKDGKTITPAELIAQKYADKEIKPWNVKAKKS